MKISQATAEYVKLKQSMGSRFRSEAVILRAFAHALDDNELSLVDSDRVRSYIAGRGPVTLFWHRKYQTLRGFYRFAIARDYVATNPLPLDLPKPTRVFVPYIFSSAELKCLLERAVTYPQEHPRSLLEPFTIRVLLLLLYGAGLRIGEALSLKRCEVDWAAQILTISNSKFYKTRLVPMGAKLTQIMWEYANRSSLPKESARPEVCFFLTTDGTPIKRGMAERTFRTLCDSAGIRRPSTERYQPRLHDLRHTRTVHGLTAWYKQGADVNRLLPKLSRFLGHVNVVATQRYLTLTPDLLTQANRRFFHFVNNGGSGE